MNTLSKTISFMFLPLVFIGCKQEKLPELEFTIVNPLTVVNDKLSNNSSRLYFQYAHVGEIGLHDDNSIQSVVDRTMCNILKDSISEYAIAEYDFVNYPDSSSLNEALNSPSEWSDHSQKTTYIAEFSWKKGVFHEKQSYSLSSDDFSSQWYKWDYDCK